MSEKVQRAKDERNAYSQSVQFGDIAFLVGGVDVFAKLEHFHQKLIAKRLVAVGIFQINATTRQLFPGTAENRKENPRDKHQQRITKIFGTFGGRLDSLIGSVDKRRRALRNRQFILKEKKKKLSKVKTHNKKERGFASSNRRASGPFVRMQLDLQLFKSLRELLHIDIERLGAVKHVKRSRVRSRRLNRVTVATKEHAFIVSRSAGPTVGAMPMWRRSRDGGCRCCCC
jgi:hypothetical protein